jgi:hypothetical protein
MMDKPTTTISEFVSDQGPLDLGLPEDRMPEAEVALRLAEFILSLPGSGAMASVAIDGASIRVGDAVIWFCREFWMRTERGLFYPKTLRSQDIELLGEG